MALFGTLKNPKGPALDDLESFTVGLSGTTFSFSLPHSNEFQIPENPPPKEINLYDTSDYYSCSDTIEPVPASGIINRWWNFDGLPIIQRGLCNIQFDIDVARLDNFPTLFRPLHFQKAIERYIFTNQGPVADEFQYPCRRNWRLDNLPSGVWAHYENSDSYSNWHIPLTENHMLVVTFNTMINDRRAEPKAVFDALMNTVMGSIKLDYSSDALRQKAEAEKQFPGEKLAENLPPLEWDMQPVEGKFQLLRTLLKKHKADFYLPNGEIDEVRQQARTALIDKETIEIQKEQQKVLDEGIQRILASHLDFS